MSRTRMLLASLVLAAGALAAFVGEPRPPLAADEVSAVQLAEWIRSQRSGLRVIDLRGNDAMQHDRVPGARAATDVDAASTQTADLLVAYAQHHDDASAIEALRNRVYPRQVLRLHGGMAVWNADVMFPTIRADASARQQRKFDRRAALSRYFGGSPRVSEPGTSREPSRSRRGC